jgi:hypothetical protein
MRGSCALSCCYKAGGERWPVLDRLTIVALAVVAIATINH